MNTVVVLCQAWCLLDSPSLPLSWLPPLCVCPFSQLAAVVSSPPAARPCHLFGFCSSPVSFLHLPTISTTPMPLSAHMVRPVTHSWRTSRTVGLSGSEFTFHVEGLAEIQALLMTLSCHSLLSMTCAWDG